MRYDFANTSDVSSPDKRRVLYSLISLLHSSEGDKREYLAIVGLQFDRQSNDDLNFPSYLNIRNAITNGLLVVNVFCCSSFPSGQRYCRLDRTFCRTPRKEVCKNLNRPANSKLLEFHILKSLKVL